MDHNSMGPIYQVDFDGLVQDCGNFIARIWESPQSHA